MTQGIVCPECGHNNHSVYYMRRRVGRVVRGIKCLRCKYFFKTVEKLEEVSTKGSANGTQPPKQDLHSTKPC